MRVELGNGMSREMTIDELLNIDWQEETANNDGEAIDNPFHDSAMYENKKDKNKKDHLSFDIPDISSVEEIDFEEE